MKKVVFVALGCLLAVASSCAVNEKTASNTSAANRNVGAVEQPTTTPEKPKFKPAEAVKYAAAKPLEIKAGGQIEGEIQIKIQEPFHVNSNPPSEKGFIPLEIELENSGGITVGKPAYPKGEPKPFAFSQNKPLSVYTGEIVVKLPLKADKSATAGRHQLTGKLKFQPCDEEVCYRPQTVEMTLPVAVN